MKKISTIIVIAVFTASFLVSCKEAQQNKEVANHHEDSEGDHLQEKDTLQEVIEKALQVEVMDQNKPKH